MARTLNIPAKLVAALVVALLLLGAVPTAAFAAGETLTVTPTSGPAGQSISFGGSGWGNSTTGVAVRFNGTLVSTCSSNNGGSLNTCVPSSYTVPGGTASGTYSVTAATADNSRTAATQFRVLAANGSGTLTTPTTSVEANSENTIVFTYTAAAGGMTNGSVAVTVPTGWSAPTTGNSEGKFTASTGSISVPAGTRDMVVTGVTLLEGATLTITYGVANGTNDGAVAPASGGSQTWNATQGSSAAATRVGLAASPSINVTNTPIATTLATSAASGTYRGSTTNPLTATITPNVAGKTIEFTLNGTSVGSAVTNGSGVATMADVSSLGTIAANTYPTGVGASFAGDGTHGSSNDTDSLTVSPRTVTGSFTAANKEYDQSTAATVTDRSLTGTEGGDVTLTGGTAAFDDANAGNGKTVTLTGATLGGTEASNYTLDSVNTTTANITKVALTGSFTAANKVYDGTTDATITDTDLSGVLAGDTVTLDGGTATFGNKNVGSDKTVSGTGFTLGGTHAGNYSLGTVADAAADITARDLNVTATAADKAYDGTSAATATLDDDRVDNDDLDLDYNTAVFDDKFVGTDKTVTVSGIAITGGDDAANYNLANTSDTDTANIAAPEALTVTFTAHDKDYDGTNVASGTYVLNGVADGDDVELTGGTKTFAATGVGVHEVTWSDFSLTGDDAATYDLDSTQATDTASIDPRELTGSFTAADKNYDGTTDATIVDTDYDVTNEVAGEDVNITGGTASFADQNVGTGITVSGTGFTLTGADKDNYVLGTVSDTTADIDPADVTASFVAANKVYDGGVVATITSSQIDSGIVAGDSISLVEGSAAFVDKNVGADKVVTADGFDLAGVGAENYLLLAIEPVTADITPIQLTASFTTEDKVYDATDAATIVSQTLNAGALDGENVTLTMGTATFDSKNVGTDKVVTASGIELFGTDASNYELGAIPTETANITVADLTPTATAQNKRYDGDADADVTIGDDRINGDDVVLTFATATFDDEVIGAGKTVTVTGIAIDSGADAGNYQLTTDTATATADITAADGILVTFAADDKVYDGTADATLDETSVVLDGATPGDDVSVTGGTVTFDDKAVGTAQTVTWDGFSLTGADAGNYELASTSSTDAANITMRALNVTATGVDKEFDGNTDATVTLADDRVAGDVLTLDYASALFASPDVGQDITVDVTGITVDGDDAANYSLVSDNVQTTADINAPVVVASKSYRADGMIKRPSTAYKGNNIYNRTGANQTKEARARRGQSRAFYVKVQNEGRASTAATQRLQVDGCSSTAGFRVAYFANGNRVTRRVSQGTFVTALLSPGETRTIKMVITPTRSSNIGAVMGCKVTVRSTRTSTNSTSETLDVVRGKVTRRR